MCGSHASHGLMITSEPPRAGDQGRSLLRPERVRASRSSVRWADVGRAFKTCTATNAEARRRRGCLRRRRGHITSYHCKSPSMVCVCVPDQQGDDCALVCLFLFLMRMMGYMGQTQKSKRMYAVFACGLAAIVGFRSTHVRGGRGDNEAGCRER